MTKEDLENRFIKLFDLTEGFTAKHFKWIIDEFFESNVCIPKGENRHPNADLIHAYAEGEKIQRKPNDKSCFKDCINPLWDENTEYRIKPSDPIYEWQWELLYDGQLSISIFMTEEEVILNYGKNHDRTKREETKRERK